MFRSEECNVSINNSRANRTDADAQEHDQQQWLVKGMPAIRIKASEQDTAKTCTHAAYEGNSRTHALIAPGLQSIRMASGVVGSEDGANIGNRSDYAANDKERFEAMGTDVRYESAGSGMLSTTDPFLRLVSRCDGTSIVWAKERELNTYATYGLV